MIRAILLLQTSQVLGRGLYLLFAFWYLNTALGIQAKGDWTALLSLLGILSAFSNLGFEVWLTREVAAGTISRSRALSFLFKAKSVLWLAGIMLGTLALHTNDLPMHLMIPLGFALVFDGIAVAEQAVFEGKSLANRIAVMSFLKSGGFVMIALPLAFFLKPTQITIFIWLFSLALLVRTIYGWSCWRLLPAKEVPSSDRPWQEFVLMGSYTFVTIVYFKVDALMLHTMISPEEAGHYGNAYDFVEGALFLSAAAGTMLYPHLVRAKQGDRGPVFDAMFRIVLALGMLGSVGIWLLGIPFGLALIGPEFLPAGDSMKVLGWALPIMFANGILNRWLFSFRRERFALFTAMAAAVFNLIGNWFVIPKHGAAGAAFVTVCTEGLLFITWLILGRRSLGLLVWNCLALGALSGVGFLMVFQNQLLLGSILGFTGFGFLLLRVIYRFQHLKDD